MSTVNLSDAKAHLSDLVAKAESGESVCITRRGKAVAKLTAVDTPRRPVAVSSMRALTQSMPKQELGAEEFTAQMRDESRY